MDTKKTENVMGAVFGLVVLGLALLLSPYIYDKTSTSIGSASSASAVAIQGNVTANVYSGLSLASIAPILMGVGIVLGLLGTFFYVTQGQ